MTLETFPFMFWNEEPITISGHVVESFTHRRCTKCGHWVKCVTASGQENHNDYDHWVTNHNKEA